MKKKENKTASLVFALHVYRSQFFCGVAILIEWKNCMYWMYSCVSKITAEIILSLVTATDYIGKCLNATL